MSPARAVEDLRWDVACTMAVYRFPRWLVHRLLDSRALSAPHVQRAADLMRRVRSAAQVKARFTQMVTGRGTFVHAN